MSSITLGGKGSTLTASTIFTLAISPSTQITLDPSLSQKPISNSTPTLIPLPISLPPFLSPPLSRASLITLLSQLTLSHTTPLPTLNAICKSLNENDVAGLVVSVRGEEERGWMEGAVRGAVLEGVCAVLDYEVSSMVLIGEGVAALSVEAGKGKVSAGVFNVDSGDGKCVKDEAGVAGDLKVLLNGSSSLAGGGVGVGEGDGIVERVVEVYGSLREAVRGVHGRVRVGVNSVGGGKGKAWEVVLVGLAVALRNVGEESLRRVEGVGKEGLREVKCACPTREEMKEVFRLGSEAALEEDYVKLAHFVDVLFELVRKVLCVEMMSAVLVLAGGEGEKKGKKKKVLGKGTNVIMQVVRERIRSLESVVSGEERGLEKVVEEFFSFLDPKGREFGEFADKVKEIVESNESRRLPKLPKVVMGLSCFWVFLRVWCRSWSS